MKIYSIKRANKDYPEDNIKKGDPYFYCRPKGLKKIKNKSKSLLEEWIRDYIKSHQGEFASNMERWQVAFTELIEESDKEELLEEIDDFISQKEDSLSNIPDQLQESHVINEQLEELNSFRDEVEGWDDWIRSEEDFEDDED